MQTATGPIVYELSPTELQRRLAAGTVRLVDVREPDEHRCERIPGAENVPLSSFTGDLLKRSGPPPVLHCKSGQRSSDAAQRMLRAGWSEVHQLAGGIEAWKRAGLPVERDARAPLPILQQVQIAIGALVLLGCAASWLVSPYFLGLPAFFGAGLLYAGLSGTCGFAVLLAKMPWNRGLANRCDSGCAR